MNKELRVGAMFLVALGILAAAIYFMGDLRDTLTYQVRFNRVKGLAVDSPVHFNGVPLGRVERMTLSNEFELGKPVDIIVKIEVHTSLKNHVRKSTVAEIKSVGVLGDKYILLETRDYNAPLLDEGEFINQKTQNVSVDELLAQGTDLFASISSIMEDLKLILAQLSEGDGLVQRLIGDEQLAQQLATVLKDVLTKIQSGESMVGMLLSDPQFGQDVSRKLQNGLDGLNRVMDSVEKGDGVVPMLLSDEAFKAEVQGKVTDVLAGAQQLIEGLNSSKGLLYKVTQDEAYGEEIAQNLKKASYHLASILEKIDEGDGTASLLLNDPSLYQGVYEVVYGVKHSGLTKWFIQRKRKKGDKLLEKAEGGDAHQEED